MVQILVKNKGKKSEPGITISGANKIKTVIRKAFKGQVDRPNISTNTADGTITISNFNEENSETMQNLVRRALTGGSTRARVKFEIIVTDEEE
tara:strand:- start:51 stop:329 length:279 start_codon:yes stop_codon:yes gene_type:complete